MTSCLHACCQWYCVLADQVQVWSLFLNFPPPKGQRAQDQSDSLGMFIFGTKMSVHSRKKKEWQSQFLRWRIPASLPCGQNRVEETTTTDQHSYHQIFLYWTGWLTKYPCHALISSNNSRSFHFGYVRVFLRYYCISPRGQAKIGYGCWPCWHPL